MSFEAWFQICTFPAPSIPKETKSDRHKLAHQGPLVVTDFYLRPKYFTLRNEFFPICFSSCLILGPGY